VEVTATAFQKTVVVAERTVEQSSPHAQVAQ
jgi:hypothetical protein